MKHFAKLLLSLLLIAGVSLGYADVNGQRSQKQIEEGDKIVEPLVPYPSKESTVDGFRSHSTPYRLPTVEPSILLPARFS